MNEIKKLIYVSHDYGGKEENKHHLEQELRRLVMMFPDYTFVSAVHCFGFMYHEMSYDEGMRHCLALLDMCDENWFIQGHCSGKGCGIERQYSIEHQIPVKLAPACDECEFNDIRRCGVDFCVLPGCVKEGGGRGKASDG